MTSIETKVHELADDNEALTRIITQLKVEIHRLRLRDAQTQLEERIAALPTASQERLRTAFPGTDLGGLKQAVTTERKQMSKQDARVERILG